MKYLLSKDGFEKFKINPKNKIILNKFKKEVVKILNLEINQKIKLENMHKYMPKDVNFNDLKLNITNKINATSKNNQIIFNILKNNLLDLLGPDISGQKNINLVIQKPFDKSYVPLHKDAPELIS